MRPKRSLALLVAVIVLVALLAGGQYLASHQSEASLALRSLVGAWGSGETRFVDRARQAGLHYRWTISGPRPIDILQGIGNGCAFLDYDGDGDLDILLVGDHPALYRGDGRGHFTDVTQQAGLSGLTGHFLGCAVGDYDNDGYDDIYLSGYRCAALLHNEAGRGFREVTAQSGLRPQPWGTSCAWADLDNDGRLDLYVDNYVDFDPPRTPRVCNLVIGEPGACPPKEYRPLRGVLYHNEGGGRFRDVTAAWGADHAAGNALGVACADFTGDGRQGICVANDTRPGDLFLNTGHGLKDIAQQAGTAQVDNSDYAGMGVDWGDYDNDGHPDLVIGTFAAAAKPVFHNDGPGVFSDQSAPLGLREPTYPYLTFGAKWLDYDNDGWLDLMLTNGHVRDNVSDYQPQVSYKEPTLLFHNEAGRHLSDVSEQAGPDLPRHIVGRGLAVGDYDNDGKVDALVVDSEGAPLLLHNEGHRSGHWLEVSLIGTRSNRDAYGAAVTVTAGGKTQRRWCHADGSYLSSSDKRVHLGLGAATAVTTLSIRWPSGTVTTLQNVPADRTISVREPH